MRKSSDVHYNTQTFVKIFSFEYIVSCGIYNRCVFKKKGTWRYPFNRFR
jgi:hypothetical protein